MNNNKNFSESGRLSTNELQVTQEGFIGLQFAQRITQGILRRLVGGVPLRFCTGATPEGQVYMFAGNNSKVTIIVEKQEGRDAQ